MPDPRSRPTPSPSRPRRRLLHLGGVAAVAGALLLAGCGGSDSYDGGGDTASTTGTQSGQAATPRPVVVNQQWAPLTLDPAASCNANDAQVIGAIYKQLTQYGVKKDANGNEEVDTGKIVPYAAESWKVSDDGKTYTFTLKPDQTFPSGEPLDAAAVKYSIDRIYAVNACGPAYLDLGYPDRLIEKVSVVDPLTVEFQLSKADTSFPQALAQMAGSIVDKSVVDAHGGIAKGKVNPWLQTHSAGGGAYLLDSYEPNRQVVLTPNPDNTVEPKAGASKLTINFITADQTLLLQARSGAADLTLGLTKQSASSLKSDPKVTVVSNLTPLQEEINFVHTIKPFDNAKFREGLSYALPYDQIKEKVAFGYGDTYYGPVDPKFSGYDAADSAARPYDVDKAKQLIAESGVKTPVKSTIVVQEGNTTEKQIATIAQAEWKKVGLDATVKTLSAADFASSIFSFKYPIHVRVGGPGVVDFGFYAGYDNGCDHAYNVTKTCDKSQDALLAKARAEPDEAKRNALYAEYTRNWVASSPKIPVYADQYVAVLKKGLQGYVYSHNFDLRRLAQG